jgi:hypothetical protein
MRARYQITHVTEGVVLAAELQSRNKWTALHELLKVSGVEYDPAEFKERGDWVQFVKGEFTYKTSTKFG